MKKTLFLFALLLGFFFCHAGKLPCDKYNTAADTAKPTLIELLNNLKAIVALATGEASVKDGVDREKVMREGLFRSALSSKQLLDSKLPKPANETETILFEMAQACTYGLLGICYQKNYIPEGNPYNYARDAAIYQPLAEHALAYWSYKPEKLKSAYNQGSLNASATGWGESFAQVMNKMLHRQMMDAYSHSGSLSGMEDIRQNIWNYLHIYFKMFKEQKVMENTGPLTDLFGGKPWWEEEYYKIPKWSVWLSESANADDKQLLWDTYMSSLDYYYNARKGGFNRTEHFGKDGLYLGSYYVQRVPMAEKYQDAIWKEKYGKNYHHGLNIVPKLLTDFFDPGWTPAPGMQDEIKRLTQKYLVRFTDEAFAVRMRKKDYHSLYHIAESDIKEANFIFNVMKINLPEEEKNYCDHLVELLRHRAGENILGDDLSKADDNKRNEEAGYFKSIIEFLKKYAARYNISTLSQKLDEISAAMEKDPYTAAPPRFFQDEAVLNLVKNL